MNWDSLEDLSVSPFDDQTLQNLLYVLKRKGIGHDTLEHKIITDCCVPGWNSIRLCLKYYIEEYPIYYNMAFYYELLYEHGIRINVDILKDLKKKIVYIKYISICEYLYKDLSTNPELKVRTLLSGHKKIKSILNRYISEQSTIYGLIIDNNEEYFSFSPKDSLMRLEMSYSCFISVLKNITELYIDMSISMDSLKLPHYVVLWIFEWLNYDIEYFEKIKGHVFRGFDKTIRKNDTKKILIFDLLSRFRKIRIIENVQLYKSRKADKK